MSKKPETIFGEKFDAAVKLRFGKDCTNENIQQVGIRGTADRVICIRGRSIRAELKVQIEELTNQIEKHRGAVREIQGHARTMEGEISILNNQIKRFELEIRRIKLIIGGIEAEIGEAELNIKEFEQQTENEKVILGELIREIYKYDETSFL